MRYEGPIPLAAGEIYCMKLGLNFNVLMKSADIDPVPLEQCDREMKALDRVGLDGDPSLDAPR